MNWHLGRRHLLEDSEFVGRQTLPNIAPWSITFIVSECSDMLIQKQQTQRDTHSLGMTCWTDFLETNRRNTKPRCATPQTLGPCIAPSRAESREEVHVPLPFTHSLSAWIFIKMGEGIYGVSRVLLFDKSARYLAR